MAAPFPADTWTPKNGASKPETIARQKEEAEAEWESTKPERIDALALSPRTGRIVVAGVKIGDGVGMPITAASEKDEAGLLEDVWAYVLQSAPLVSFGGLDFDMPFLCTRSALLGVRPVANSLSHVGVTPFLRRYVYDRHVDIRMLLANWDRHAHGTKSEWAAAFGLPAQEHSGADVGRLYRAGDFAAIARHCVADLNETWAMYTALAPLYLGRAA
jgi:predicted PolB exonuclease-like 3'-5' exonuclease